MLSTVQWHRFLTTEHVQQLVFTDHRSSISAARTCRRVLARLQDDHLIERLDRRVGGLRGGSATSVWMLTSAGQRLLGLREGRGSAVRVRQPGGAFIGHYLAIADVRLALLGAVRAQQLELLSLELEPTCWRHYLDPMGTRQVLKPDLFAVTATATYEDHWFIEVDRGTEGIPTLVRQCQAYAQYRASGTEQSETGLFPRIIWILPTARRLENFRLALRSTRSLDAGLFHAVTMDDLVPLLTGGGTE
ncbi:replication-relaxation family protein [Geodermatophilus sp. DF01-2]|uniref:replication-relaxation family protein n=1 Tax=Geodermatophilus sp. DF01-2 TaxID=2559610 RepID=UPI00142FE1AC|nr:replication-relaxation family protein [Geodermatophilus sp. DF01_2]